MIRILLLVGATLLSTTSLAETNHYGETNPESDAMPSDFRGIGMLPVFNATVDPEATVRDYPLGVISRRVAAIRHGSPHKIVTLANGKEGWVYEIPHQGTQKHLTPSSSPHANAQAVSADEAVHTYTLMFDNSVVIDVIYKDDGPGTGVTATEMQARKVKPMDEPPAFSWTPP